MSKQNSTSKKKASKSVKQCNHSNIIEFSVMGEKNIASDHNSAVKPHSEIPISPQLEKKCIFCNHTQFTTQEELEVHLCIEHTDQLDKFISSQINTELSSSSHTHVESDSTRNGTEEKHSIFRSSPPSFVKFCYDTLNPLKVPLLEEQLGLWRGIQGENNSCYIDSVLFAMFAFHNTFDKLLLESHRQYRSIYSKKASQRIGYNYQEQTELDEQARYADEIKLLIQARLRTDIVNELRTRCFVDSSSVIQWRRMIDHLFEGNDFTLPNKACYERDVEEFLYFLFTYFEVPPLLCFSHQAITYEMHMLQLLLPREIDVHSGNRTIILTVYDLVQRTLEEQCLVLRYHPKILVSLIPRSGKASERIAEAIVPNLLIPLKVDNITVDYRLLSLCCIDRSHYVTFCFCEESPSIQKCSEKIGSFSLLEETSMSTSNSLNNDTKPNDSTVIPFNLRKENHKDSNRKATSSFYCYFFDGMNDRINNQTNIPCIRDLSVQFASLRSFPLDSLGALTIWNQLKKAEGNGISAEMQRMMKDVAICFYKSCNEQCSMDN